MMQFPPANRLLFLKTLHRNVVTSRAMNEHLCKHTHCPSPCSGEWLAVMDREEEGSAATCGFYTGMRMPSKCICGPRSRNKGPGRALAFSGAQQLRMTTSPPPAMLGAEDKALASESCLLYSRAVGLGLSAAPP